MNRYLSAFDAEQYEVAILQNRGTPDLRMRRARLTPPEIMDEIPFLKRENARGADIFIRPDDTRFVLVDDVDRNKIEQMKRDGLEPAAVLETSPSNHQVWLKLSNDPIKKELASQAGKWIAETYDSDPNSSDWRHLGRMPGFTNRKPKHERDGLAPYVLIHENKGTLASKGDHILNRAEESWRKEQVKRAFQQDRTLFQKGDMPKGGYLEQVSRMKRMPLKKDGSTDWSRVDFRAAKGMAQGGFYEQAIKKEIIEHSPNLTQRKGPHVKAYVGRTVKKAMDIAFPFNPGFLSKAGGDFEKSKRKDDDRGGMDRWDII